MNAPVIVGFDGAASAYAAVRHAALQATRRGSELRIVHAFGWFLLPSAMYPPLADIDRGPREALLDLLTRTASEVRTAWPHLKVSTRLIDGSASAVLIDASRDAQLVVVGHRGTGGFAGLLAGSTATQLAGHASCPVTVVRDADTTDRTVIVLGMDGSVQAAAAAEVAFAEARRGDAELVLVSHGHADAGPEADMITAQTDQLARHYRDVKYRRESAEAATPATALIDTADRLHAAMIIVGSRGHGGFRGLITGSTSRALIDHAGCPVTVVPSPAA
ncbi:universal stress protein [Actinoplanes sp. NBRC 103695]|uniref:universal stress protein n=1 Tax=Actinoplanes sp. NBRC 103695 TaxID=3032202 RepID=UPI0024A3A1B6|nr:universal stress protein [Actinoplanes sp. NBRC 103695]GLZ02033.1 universal stress protein [Actinoplanes sp. NBRC 103695]